MRRTTIICDRCGAVANGDVEQVVIRWGTQCGDVLRQVYDESRLDLCAACAGELREWAKGADDASVHA